MYVYFNTTGVVRTFLFKPSLYSLQDRISCFKSGLMSVYMYMYDMYVRVL